MEKVIEYKFTETEEWYDICGFEAIYQLSNHLRVRSLDRTINYSNGRVYKQKGQILKCGSNQTGHLFVVLSKNNISKTIGLHVLIAKMFISNPLGLKLVEHNDDNPLNNYPYNLKWSDGSSNGLNANYRSNKANVVVPILQYDLQGNFIKEHISISIAQRLFNEKSNLIQSNLINRTKSAYGYIWKYKNENHQPGLPLVINTEPLQTALF